MAVKNLSLFFPFYNEEKKAAEAIIKAYEVLPALGLESFEVLAIDDGSRDQTGAILDRLKKEKFKDLNIIHHSLNQGYGSALKFGFYGSSKDWICFTDGDLQFDLTEIDKLLKKADEAELVVGFYLERKVGWVRKLNTFFWNNLVRMLFNIKIRDIDCGFKLIKKEVIEKIDHLESNGAFISTELLAKAQKARFKIVEVGVHHYSDTAGGSTGANPRVIVKAFVDLLRLWRRIR